jgi:hypothetical protein
MAGYFRHQGWRGAEGEVGGNVDPEASGGRCQRGDGRRHAPLAAAGHAGDIDPILAARKPLKGVTPKQAEGYRTAIPKGGWKEWEVPFDTDRDWPKALADALTAYRDAWRAEMEELVDKPDPVEGVVRVTGPFTIEGVIAVEDGPDTPIGGAPDELETFDGEAAVVHMRWSIYLQIAQRSPLLIAAMNCVSTSKSSCV